LVESVVHYRDLLNKLDEDFPADFPLNDLLDRVPKGRALKEEIQVIQGSPEPVKSQQEPPAKTEPAPDTDENKTPAADGSAGEKKQAEKEPEEKTEPADKKLPAADASKKETPSGESADAPPTERKAD
jgi:hypothetical protein